MISPYDPGKFPNKWRKMEADKPARTLMAHLGKDGYSHIHYDSSQARTILQEIKNPLILMPMCL